MDDYLLIGIFTISALSGFIGNLMSGGGLINVPLMIVMGLPPHVAIATNRMGSLGMEASALARYLGTGYIYWPWVAVLALLAITGGYIGANIVIDVKPAVLEPVVAILILCLLPVLWAYRRIGVKAHISQCSFIRKYATFVAYFLVMIYGGFFGAGSGPFFIMVLCGLGGMTILQAKASTAIPWFCMGCMASVIFWSNGLVIWPYCIAAILGMAAGGYAGSHTAIKAGNENLRLIFMSFCGLIALVLLIR